MPDQGPARRLPGRLTNPLPQLIPQRVVRVKEIVGHMVWERSEELEVSGGRITEKAVPLARAMRSPMRRVRPGEAFGKPWGSWGQRWMRVRIPAPRPGERGRRHLRWECPGEATVWIDDRPWAGLDPGHLTCPLPDRAATLWMDLGLWQTMWGGDWSRKIGKFGLRFESAQLRVRNEEAWAADWDLEVLVQYMLWMLGDLGTAYSFGFRKTLEAAPPGLRRLLRLLDLACDGFDEGGIPALRRALARVYRAFPAEPFQPAGGLVGHAHLDQVWLWPESATEHKAVHTFANQLRLMERYPEYVFNASQPSQYRIVERLAPAQAREVRARIRTGQWDADGVFEVESDTNLPCGESLARQTVVGQRKFRDLTGRLSRVCWIPDVFGYTACLPQVLALGGARYFFTTKMTWSQVTKFPYTSFVWRGMDGTEVVTHLCSTTYNGEVSLSNNVAALREHRQADVHPEMLLPTGYGDGGGGVNAEMCEKAWRMRSLAGVPKTSWTSTGDFFRRLEGVRKDLPVYQGELYLEYHRGTYTTQSEYKRRHRALERALQAHEAVRVARGGGQVDEKAWQRLLFGEFHDALPGSSIAIVYRQLGGELEARAKSELDAAVSELASRGSGWSVFNPVAIPRRAVVDIPGRREPVLVELAGLEGRPVAEAERGGPGTIREASPRKLDNGIVRAGFDEDGRLASISVSGDQLEIEGAGFALYHDDPHGCDAWDIDHQVLAAPKPAVRPMALKVVERGPFRAILEGSSPVGKKSRLTVRYILEAGSSHLRIEVAVDWRESHKLLKYHVRTGYRGRRAVFGAPFGSIDRPQQPGTEREEAMWEVPGSRWAAVIRDDGQGLAMVTEAKYGFSCRDGDLGLSLLRAPKGPDDTADMGSHRIRFAVGGYEPTSDGGVASTAACAETLFAPVLISRGASTIRPPFRIDEPGSLVASWALPCAESKGFIVRLHETAGSSGEAILRLAKPGSRVDLVDFLERPLGRLARRPDGAIPVPYLPYQILSVRVRG